MTAPTRPADGETPALLLTATDGPYKGQTFTLAGHQVFLVGRSKQSHLPIGQDRYVSRNHFLVEVNPPQCRLTDLNSRTGTFVNGQRVQVADLHAGDVIKAGRTCLMVSLPTAPPAESARGDDEAVTLAPGGEGQASQPTGSLPATAATDGPDTIYSEGAAAAAARGLEPFPRRGCAMEALLTPAPAPAPPPAAVRASPAIRSSGNWGAAAWASSTWRSARRRTAGSP